MPELLRGSDKQIICQFLSPDYIIPAARHYGNGDPVLGALDGYREARNAIREYIRFVRYRDNLSRHDLSLAQSLRALGWIGNFQKVSPFSEDRSVALSAWKGADDNIPGAIQVYVEGAPQDVAQRAAVRVISRLFEDLPHLNRALLDGKVWRRHDPTILHNIKLEGRFPRSLSYSPANWGTDAEHKKQMKRMLRRLLQVEKHELRPLGEKLMCAWNEVGFIASPAAAMISTTNTSLGWSCLYPPNGIPLAFNIGRLESGSMNIGVSVSHRVFDGSDAEEIYDYLEKEVPAELRRTQCE